MKAGDGRNDLHLKNCSPGQLAEAAPGRKPGSGEAAGSVPDSEQVDRSPTQVGQSA